MTNEEEQITLNIDLYDNIMTEKEGDYTGRPRITGTLYNKQIAARIVKAGTESTNRKASSISSIVPTKRK